MIHFDIETGGLNKPQITISYCKHPFTAKQYLKIYWAYLKLRPLHGLTLLPIVIKNLLWRKR